MINVFIDVNSITINNVSMGQYLTQAKYGYHKLWGKDTGRNLAGNNSGTLLGIFPKLTLSFRKLTKTELELLSPLFDSATQSTRYYDPRKKAYVTLSTYSGDWEIVNKHIINDTKKNESFDLAFISNKKRP